MPRSRRAVSEIACVRARGIGSWSRSRRMNAFSSRPDLFSTTCADEPLVQSRPKLAGCSLSPEIFTTRSFSTCSTMPQPTPQYGQTVLTLREVMPRPDGSASRPRQHGARRSYRHPHLAGGNAGPVRAHRMLGGFQAFAAAQVEVMLVDGRCDHDPLAQAADQAAREHRRLRGRIEIVDGKHAAGAIVEMEHGDLRAVDERAHAGVRHDVVQFAHRNP